MIFPLPFVPAQAYRGGLGWNADRSKVAAMYNKQAGKEVFKDNNLRHPAVDLMGPWGTPVLAMADGEVIRPPYFFFDNTYALEIRHKDFIARYCEIMKKTLVQVGQSVKEGQVIAYIGDQSFYAGDMLHLELYRNTSISDLNLDITPENAPFYRRRDVFDPTAMLDSVAHTALRDLSKSYPTVVDADGRTFLAPVTLDDL